MNKRTIKSKQLKDLLERAKVEKGLTPAKIEAIASNRKVERLRGYKLLSNVFQNKALRQPMISGKRPSFNQGERETPTSRSRSEINIPEQYLKVEPELQILDVKESQLFKSIQEEIKPIEDFQQKFRTMSVGSVNSLASTKRSEKRGTAEKMRDMKLQQRKDEMESLQSAPKLNKVSSKLIKDKYQKDSYKRDIKKNND